MTSALQHSKEQRFPWLVMDFVAGRSLSQVMSEGNRFAIRRSPQYFQGACEGAAAIWAAGTAHRDLSPNNLLITEDGDVVIVDLGLARHVDDETITTLPTPGTPGWMSPEQADAGSQPR